MSDSPVPASYSSDSSAETAFQQNLNYEATVSQIETIINRIEMGELELAEVFEQFAIATDYLRQCEAFLNYQKRQMDLLIETLVDESEAF
jgi:exodeoxyribonuclease VII small subunit